METFKGSLRRMSRRQDRVRLEALAFIINLSVSVAESYVFPWLPAQAIGGKDSKLSGWMS